MTSCIGTVTGQTSVTRFQTALGKLSEGFHGPSQAIVNSRQRQLKPAQARKPLAQTWSTTTSTKGKGT